MIVFTGQQNKQKSHKPSKKHSNASPFDSPRMVSVYIEANYSM